MDGNAHDVLLIGTDPATAATIREALAAPVENPFAIVVLTNRDGEDTAREAVQRGAKDRVLKEHIDGRPMIAEEFTELLAAPLRPALAPRSMSAVGAR